MPQLPELNDDKLYYSIGEVSKMFGVAASLLRFWEGEFENLRPKKNSKGNRMYAHKDIEIVHKIFHLTKERGYTLQGAKDYLKKNKGKLERDLDILHSLKTIREFLVEIKEKI